MPPKKENTSDSTEGTDNEVSDVDKEEESRISRIVGRLKGKKEPIQEKYDRQIANYKKKLDQQMAEGRDAERKRTDQFHKENETPARARGYILPKEEKQRILTTPDLLIFILVIGIHVADALTNFQRTPQAISSFFAIYVVIAFLCATYIRHESEGKYEAFFKKFFPLAILAVVWPRLLGFGFNLVPNVGNMTLGSFTILEFLFVQMVFFPIFPLLAYMSSRSYFRNWIYTYIMLSFIAIFIFAMANQLVEIPGGTGINFQGNMGAEKYTEFLQQNWEKFIGDIVGIPQVIDRGINSTINTIYEPYFYGEVEQKKGDTEIGVYVKNLRSHYQKIHPNDDKVVVYADIIGKSFTEPTTIRTLCKARYLPTDAPPHSRNYTIIQGTIDYPSVKIQSYQENTIKCTLPPISTKDTTATVSFLSSFNFVTWGYMTYSFMDSKELYITKPALTPATAVYTPGPLELGLVNSKEPPMLPIGVEEGNPLPLFGVTLKNSRAYTGRGTILKITQLVFHIPRPLQLIPGSCEPQSWTSTMPSSDDTYTYYYFRDVPVRYSEEYQTISCRLSLNPLDMQSFLGEGGKAFRTFSVEANYDYQITEDLKIPVSSDPR